MSLMNELPEYTEPNGSGYVPYSEDGEHLGKISMENLGAGLGGGGLQYWRETEKAFYNVRPMEEESDSADDGHIEFNAKHYNKYYIPEGGTEYEWTTGGVANADVALAVTSEDQIFDLVTKKFNVNPHASNDAGNVPRIDDIPLAFQCPAREYAADSHAWNGVGLPDVEPSAEKIYECQFDINVTGMGNYSTLEGGEGTTPPDEPIYIDMDDHRRKPWYYLYDKTATVHDDPEHPQPYSIFSMRKRLYEEDMANIDIWDQQLAQAVNNYQGDGWVDVTDDSIGDSTIKMKCWAILYPVGTERNMSAQELEQYRYLGVTTDNLAIAGDTITINGAVTTVGIYNVVNTANGYFYWTGTKWEECEKIATNNTILTHGYDVSWDGSRIMNASDFPNDKDPGYSYDRSVCKDYLNSTYIRRPMHITLDVPELDDQGQETMHIWRVIFLCYARETFCHSSDVDEHPFIQDFERYPFYVPDTDPPVPAYASTDNDNSNIPHLALEVPHWAYYEGAKPEYDIIDPSPSTGSEYHDNKYYSLSEKSQKEYYKNAKEIAQQVIKLLKLKSRDISPKGWEGQLVNKQYYTSLGVEGDDKKGYHIDGGLLNGDFDLDNDPPPLNDNHSFSLVVKHDDARFIGEYGSVFKIDQIIMGAMNAKPNPLASNDNGDVTKEVDLLDVIQGKMAEGANIKFTYEKRSDGYLITKINAIGGGGGGSTVTFTEVANTNGRKIGTISIDGADTDIMAPRITVDKTENSPTGFDKFEIKEAANDTSYKLATFYTARNNLPAVGAAQNGKVMRVVNGDWALADVTGSLPAVSSLDDGLVLKVISGAWAKGSVAELPAVSSLDNGKILKVAAGQWTVGTESGGGSTPDMPGSTLSAISIKDSSYEGTFMNLTDYNAFVIKSWGPYGNNDNNMAIKRIIDISFKMTSGTNIEAGDKLRLWMWPSGEGTSHVVDPIGYGYSENKTFKPSFQALDVTVDIDPISGTALAHIGGHLLHYVLRYGSDTLCLMAEILHANSSTVASGSGYLDYSVEQIGNY